MADFSWAVAAGRLAHGASIVDSFVQACVPNDDHCLVSPPPCIPFFFRFSFGHRIRQLNSREHHVCRGALLSYLGLSLAHLLCQFPGSLCFSYGLIMTLVSLILTLSIIVSVHMNLEVIK